MHYYNYSILHYYIISNIQEVVLYLLDIRPTAVDITYYVRPSVRPSFLQFLQKNFLGQLRTLTHPILHYITYIHDNF